ncbi:MAG: Lrp/AsnC family transcriptional regulator [Clostridiales bacterium]|nr:Lrp/AsnC family transcriptional regulator [Clostridiales bacterium]
MKELIKILDENTNLTLEELASLTGKTEEQVKEDIEKLKKDGLICGNKMLINWNKANSSDVFVLVELKVVPQKETGFEKIAEEILSYKEVKNLYLMAGAYDFAVFVKGSSIQEVSAFVSNRLATMECVTSTATHFILTTYKELGVKMTDSTSSDGRSMIL